jgi:hypothetical protein
MNVLKKVLLGLAVIIAIPLIAALFLEKTYHVEREVVINKPVSVVFSYVKQLKNQENYSVWSMMDPNMKKEYLGTDGTVGFVASWSSDNKQVGVGEQEIKAIVENERLDFELRFFKPFKATDAAYMTTIAVSDTQTKVVWGFNGRMKYPMNLMLVTMNMDKMLGDALQTGLDNLKGLLEKE